MRADLGRTLLHARSTWRLTEVVRVLMVWAAPGLAALLALCVLDNVLHLPGWVRLSVALLWLLGMVLTCLFVVAPVVSRRRSYDATARMLEERLAIEDNVLINALQLRRDARSGTVPVPDAALREVAGEADEAVVRMEVARLWRLRPFVRAVRWGIVAAVLVAVYVFLFPEYAANALSRYSRPLAELAPLAAVRIEVEPGDARLVAGETLEVRAAVSARRGELPRGATLRFRSAGEPWQTRSMTTVSREADGLGFVDRVGPLDADLEYRVESGDGRTRVFRVEVVQPPRVVGAALSLVPPRYTGQESSVIEEPTVLRALRGSRAELSFLVNRTPATATLHLPGAGPVRKGLPEAQPRVRFPFAVAEPGVLRLSLRNRASGAERPDAWTAPMTVLEDAMPRVTVAAESRSLILPPGAKLSLTAQADDDYGLAGLRFVVLRVSTQAATELKLFRYRAPGIRRAVERLVVPLDPASFVPGEQYRFFLEAGDYHPSGEHVVSSPAVVVRIARAGELGVDTEHPLASAFELLRGLADRQREAVAQSVNLSELYDEHVRKGRFFSRSSQMARSQASIRTDAKELAERFAGLSGGMRHATELARLAKEELAEIDRALEPGRTSRSNLVVRMAVELALPLQRKALAALEALLGRIALTAAKGDDEDEQREGDDPGKPWERDLQAKVDKLKEFLDEQRKIIALTRELEEKNPEDWTEADEEALGRLEAQELKWAKFFQDAFTDLSKVPDQDFANSDLRDEFNEVYMEVKKAAEALSAKAVEIAVPVEQSGLELAEELVHNLERWIPDTPDYQKWVMEEPAQDFDVPLADLPDELEDIVGDLIDDAESMDESVEDVSSGWMDSLDHGAGWDASGGPISNMSAKGITGNRLPNTDEIGGRSGEGRTGRSHGQFVEKTAEGKGGRETPTRLTEDPFEAGAVKDTSNEPSGGATGGGKLAGQGVEGLRGRVPPPMLDKLDRLASNQGELRQQAERLSRTLRKLHLPAGDLEDAARLLGWSENHLRNAVGFDLRQAQGNLKQALGRARASLKYEADTLRERGVHVPKRVRDELMEALKRPVPTGYEDILRAYYRAIAEGK